MIKLEVEKLGVDIICFFFLVVYLGGLFFERLMFFFLIIIGFFFILFVNFKIFVIVVGFLESLEDISMMLYFIKWSEIDYDDYCLVLFFINRDFFGGVLGLVWIVDFDYMSFGGICFRRMFFDENEEVMYLNIVVVMLLNYGV